MNEEKNRKLSAKEQRRLSVFEETCERLSQQGYKRNDLTISIVMANLFVFLLAIPVVAIGVLLFAWKNPISLLTPSPQGSLLFVALFIVLIMVHELIHGLTWSLYAEHHFKDIAFGFTLPQPFHSDKGSGRYIVSFHTQKSPNTNSSKLSGVITLNFASG